MPAAPETEAMQAYASARGLFFFENWTVPEATQLLHHGAFASAPRVLTGDLPGYLGDSWLAHFLTESNRMYTVVVVSEAPSARFAVRLLCHDRDLPRGDATNPDAERETVPMEDRELMVESDAFLSRYEVRIDHDQDPVRAWQLFDPALLHWLTESAPIDFSFELQNGALCGFVPGAVTDPWQLDALCLATAKVLARVRELSAGRAGATPADGRASEIEEELAEHPLKRPPRSVSAAAFHYGPLGPWRGRSRRLGLEAFFRAHAEALGLAPFAPSEFYADHIEIAVPGAITHIARGRLPGTELDGYLAFTTDQDDSHIAWSVAVADISDDDNGFAFVELPDVKRAEAEGFDISSNGKTITVWRPDRSPNLRTARALRSFCATAFPLLERAVAAAKRRP